MFSLKLLIIWIVKFNSHIIFNAILHQNFCCFIFFLNFTGSFLFYFPILSGHFLDMFGKTFLTNFLLSFFDTFDGNALGISGPQKINIFKGPTNIFGSTGSSSLSSLSWSSKVQVWVVYRRCTSSPGFRVDPPAHPPKGDPPPPVVRIHLWRHKK